MDGQFQRSSKIMTSKQSDEIRDDIEALLGEGGRVAFWKRPGVIAAGFLVLCGCVALTYFLSSKSSLQVSFVTTKVEKGNLVVEVSANGTINPVRTVTIGSELSGIVRDVNVDVNDPVSKGQVLIQLDDTKLRASVERAKATLALSQAALAEASATQKEAKAKLERLVEVRRLSGGKSPSKTEIESQEALVTRAEAAVESAKAKIVDSEEALKSAETDLSKTQIISPIDGVVLKRSVESGYAVAASLQAVELLSIATDMKNLELQVNVDEADVGAVKPGQKAYFTVSAYPDRKFPAKLTKVAFGSTTTDNVVTYVTYLDVENPDLLLRPGMTATASIRTVSLKDATLIPNTALRFKPSDVDKEGGKKGGMSMFGPPMRGSVKKSSTSVISATGAQKPAIVYVLRNGLPKEVPLTIGFTDGKMTEIVKGELNPGDEVIIDQRRRVN